MDREDSPRRGQHWRFPSLALASCLYLLATCPQQAYKNILPGDEAMRHPILVQLVEDILLHANPGTVGKVGIYHFFPECDRQAIGCFLGPGNLADLNIACLSFIENGSTELEGKRYFSILQSIEVLCAHYIKVIDAWDRQIDGG